jgi:hypothetical protein
MTMPETQPDTPTPRRFQYRLRSLFWFTTVVAVVCASFACSRQLWDGSGIKGWLLIVFLCWPSFAAYARERTRRRQS